MSAALRSIGGIEVAMQLIDELKQIGKGVVLGHTPVGDKAVDVVMSFLSKLQDVSALTDITGISPNESEVRDFVKNVVAVSAILESISDELGEIASESISDSISNIMYSSWLGLMDMVMRNMIGGMPPQSPMYLSNIHTKWLAWLDSLAGQHYWPTVMEFWYKRYQELAESLWADNLFKGLIDTYRYIQFIEWFMVAWVSRLLETAITRLYDSVVGALEALFARVVDAEQEYLAAKTLYDNGLISIDDFNEVQAKIDSEITAAEQELSSIIADFQSALNELLSEWYTPSYLSQWLSTLEQAIDNVVTNVMSEVGEYAKQLYFYRYKARPDIHKLKVFDESNSQVTEVTVQ